MRSYTQPMLRCANSMRYYTRLFFFYDTHAMLHESPAFVHTQSMLSDTAPILDYNRPRLGYHQSVLYRIRPALDYALPVLLHHGAPGW